MTWRSPHLRSARRGIALLLPVLLLGPVCHALSEWTVRSVSLTIAQGGAWVREELAGELDLEAEEFLLENVPPEADLSTLVVRARHLPLRMKSWERLSPSAVTRRVPSDVFTWRPGGRGEASESEPSEIRPIRCVLEAPLRVPRVILEVTYQLSGFGWSAHYQVAVRGEREDEREPVSVDLTGMVRIQNTSARTFSNASIQLVGAPVLPGRQPLKAPGFLLFNEESALSDLWLNPVVLEEVEHLYPLPGRHTLEAHSDLHAFFARVVRRPADRLYVLNSEEYPLDSGKMGQPLKKKIVFKNEEAQGLGFPLPAGEAEIFLGGQRTHRLQSAWFAHASAGDEIRIDLGEAGEVTGLRRTLHQQEFGAGSAEMGFEIVLANLGGRDIRVEVSEKPPLVLEWNVLRSNKPCQIEAQRILFRPEVKSLSEEKIEYRLRVRKPKL